MDLVTETTDSKVSDFSPKEEHSTILFVVLTRSEDPLWRYSVVCRDSCSFTLDIEFCPVFEFMNKLFGDENFEW